MNRFWKICLLVGYVLLNDPIMAQNVERPVIVLDPGHGGTDPGAIGINGAREKDIALAVGKEVARLNRELYDNGLEIYLTRYRDTLISLRHRTQLAKALRADVFVSIHCNQAERRAAQGVEVYINHPMSKIDMDLQERSETVASIMLWGFHESLGFRKRGVKQANFQVLRDLRLTCPAVLLELGFLSNLQESEHSTKKSSITGYAMVILQTLKMESDGGIN